MMARPPAVQFHFDFEGGRLESPRPTPCFKSDEKYMICTSYKTQRVILLARFILYIWAPDVVILYHTRTKTSCHCSAAQSSWLTRLFWGVAHQSESGRLSHWDGHPEREIQTWVAAAAASEPLSDMFVRTSEEKCRSNKNCSDALSDLVETFSVMCMSQHFYIFYIANRLSRSKLAYYTLFYKGKSLFWKHATMLLLCTCSLILPF